MEARTDEAIESRGLGMDDLHEGPAAFEASWKDLPEHIDRRVKS